MGKVLIVGIFVISAIFIIIILSVQAGTSGSKELLSENLTEIQAKALCREALNYGVKRVNDAGSSGPLPPSQTFVDFKVGKGIIDSIEYTTLGDTIKISAYATYQNGNDTFHHKSSTLVTWGSGYGPAAITANGNIDIGGASSVSGGINPYVNPALDFENFFGITMAEMRAIADTVYNHDYVNPPINPGGFSGVTYVSFTNPTGILQISRSSWSGSGLLVVDGNCSITGGDFTGVIWCTGSLFIRGNDSFNGAIYNEGIDNSGGPTLDVRLRGTSDITYDAAAVEAAFALIGQTISSKLKELSIFEDD